MDSQLKFDFEYGISREQACILCHLSSECAGCCVDCTAEGMNDGCNGRQECTLPSRGHNGQRWETWMYLVAHSLPKLRRFVPKKYRKCLKRIKNEH